MRLRQRALLWICLCLPGQFAEVHGESMLAAGLAAPQAQAKARLDFFEVPVPTLGCQDVLIRERSSSMNHLDLLWQVLSPGPVWTAAESLWSLTGGFPKVLGMDVAGTVVAVGSEVARLNVGDDVWAFNAAAAVYDGQSLGGLAGHAWAPYLAMRERDVGLKPKSINFTEAGVLPLVAETSLQALKLAGAPWEPGATVLILGATSGTGHVAVQLAKALGASTIIATASKQNADFVHSLGSDELIDYRTENWWDVIPDRTVDAIFDTVLQPMTGDRAFAKLKDGGKFVSMCGGIPVCGAPMPSIGSVLRRPSLSASALRCMAGSCASVANLNELRAFVDAGKLRGRVDAVVPLQEIQRAVDLLSAGHVVGKVAIAIADDDADLIAV